MSTASRPSFPEPLPEPGAEAETPGPGTARRRQLLRAGGLGGLLLAATAA
ncbi:hypothetical protein HC023_08475, partial [Streptomyces sp. NEAU-H3]|nr:hypothetical protein [Streptomyces sp. NEAU-H3]